MVILKMPITTAADNNFLLFFFLEKMIHTKCQDFVFPEKKLSAAVNFFRENNVYISCDSSAKQIIHMKCQDLFQKKKIKKIKIKILEFCLLGALRVNTHCP